MLAHHTPNPRRHHLWLWPQVPREAAFAAQVQEMVTLSTQLLEREHDAVRGRERQSVAPDAQRSNLGRPTEPTVRVEHEYPRAGALNLVAGFDMYTGKVSTTTPERKPRVECIAFLESVDREIAPAIDDSCGPRSWTNVQGQTGVSLVDQPCTLCVALSPVHGF
jgi:hypothetical protein